VGSEVLPNRFDSAVEFISIRGCAFDSVEVIFISEQSAFLFSRCHFLSAEFLLLSVYIEQVCFHSQ
jgi:hypothetical protein